MKTKKILFLITFVFSCSAVWAQGIGREVYIDEVNDYMISYPDDWSLEEGEERSITIYSPYWDDISYENASEYDLGYIEEKIQILPVRWDEGSLEEYIDANFHSLDWSELFEGFHIENEGREKINSREAIWFQTIYYIGDTSCISLFYFIKTYNKVISFTTFSKEENFEGNYKIKFLEIIRSTNSYLENKR